MDEVVGDIYAFKGGPKGLRHQGIALNDFRPLPSATMDVTRVALKTAHRVSPLKEARDQTTAYIAGGSGNQYAWFAHVGILPRAVGDETGF